VLEVHELGWVTITCRTALPSWAEASDGTPKISASKQAANIWGPFFWKETFWYCMAGWFLNITNKSALPGNLVSGFGGFFPEDQTRQGCFLPMQLLADGVNPFHDISSLESPFLGVYLPPSPP
jgi:hypothetical protein